MTVSEVDRLRSVLMRYATVLVARGELTARDARNDITGLDPTLDVQMVQELPEDYWLRLCELEAPWRKAPTR